MSLTAAPTISGFQLNGTSSTASPPPTLIRSGTRPRNTIVITGTNFKPATTSPSSAVYISDAVGDPINPYPITSVTGVAPYSFSVSADGTTITATFDAGPIAMVASPLSPGDEYLPPGEFHTTTTGITVTVVNTSGGTSQSAFVSTNVSIA